MDWKYYIEHNHDLAKAGITTDKEAMKHYLEYGYKEKRLLSTSPETAPYFQYIVDSPEIIFKEFDHVISLGHRCSSAIIIRDAGYRDGSYPFDWCFSRSSQNVLEAIKNHLSDYCPVDMKGSFNKYGIGVKAHYQKMDNHQCYQMYERRCSRFMDILKSNKKVLFVFSNEDYLHTQYYRDHSDDIYHGMVELVEYIRKTYPKLKFQVLYFDSKPRKSYRGIIHVCIHIPNKFITNVEVLDTSWRYREFCTKVLKTIKFRYNNTNKPSPLYEAN